MILDEHRRLVQQYHARFFFNKLGFSALQIFILTSVSWSFVTLGGKKARKIAKPYYGYVKIKDIIFTASESE